MCELEIGIESKRISEILRESSIFIQAYFTNSSFFEHVKKDGQLFGRNTDTSQNTSRHHPPHDFHLLTAILRCETKPERGKKGLTQIS
jgi:hypothetical protein